MNLSFHAAARERPASAALVEHGNVFTYEELLPRVEAAIRSFRAAGVAPDRPAAIEVAPSAVSIVSLWALFEMGVPALLLHPGWTDAERRLVLEEAAPVRLIALPRDVDCDRAPDEPEIPPAPLPDDERPAAILYTSGVSGRPKGVLLSRRAFAAAAAASARVLGVKEEDRWGLCMPLAHVGGLSIVTRSLFARRAVAVAAPFRADTLIRAAARDRITILSLVPTMMTRLLDREPPWRPPKHLRAILLGGAPIFPSLLKRCARIHAPVLPTWGMTETCAQAATARPDGVPHAEAAAPPLPGVELRAPGGRVEVRGPTLFSGYFPAGAHADPFDDEGWFDTGDRGFLDDGGRLHVLGRREEVLISGGENVSAPEVEAALLEHPDVEEALVFGAPDREWGERIAAAVVLREGAILDDGALRDHVEARLAPHKRPRLLAVLPALPRTAAGKTDRGEAARAALSRLRPL
ncbi:MAG: AMP-binding protein [Candidatus Eisenbacteria bacterium]|nr:AMP-binding protein [Candidatus Eisenbacteria bacterium]